MFRIFATGLAAAMLVPAAMADPVSINDPSFESRLQSPGNYEFSVPFWNAGGNAGVQYPGAAMFANIPDGHNTAFLGTGMIGGSIFEPGSIFQQVSAGVLANTRYTLAMEIGHRRDGYDLADFVVELLAGNTVLASGSFAKGDVASGAFRTLELNYDATASIAQPLTIRIATFYDPAQGSTYRQINVDNVRLDASHIVTGVPEPASWGMLIGGFGVAGAAMRRRRVQFRYA